MIIEVCLETSPTGRCMAHLPEFPGCFGLADSRREVLATVPDATRSYSLWLSRHGEPQELPKDIEPRVVEEVQGYGPFNWGDRAALFKADREPLSRDEMERLLRRADYSRADLLRTVEGLFNEELDREWLPGELTIRQILRHIGDAEQWYVSRITDPHTLPREWDDDEKLPTFDYLEMERRTAVERLRLLTDEERSATVYPARWTNHPDEPWTARKALRRLLEHEREHYHQIRDLLRGRVNTMSHW
jgi:uncharacterized damage-inducible protein DinB/predicted RNase H-like HicB family nuclease